MRYGLSVPQLGRHAAPAVIASFVRRAEDLGYRSFWVGDRVLAPVAPSDLYPGGTPEQPYPEGFKAVVDPIVALAAAATASRHSRLGMSTLNAPWYNPALLARSLTSLDHLAGGRLDCGFGISWMRDEYTAVGVPWGQRGARLDETLDVLTTIWTENPVEHHGRFFDIPQSYFDLRPATPGGPPILLAGWVPTAMERIGRRAAGWLPVAGAPLPVLDQLWQIALRAAERAGRDPALLRREMRVNVKPGATVDELAGVADEAGQAGMGGVFFDLHHATASPEEAVEFAAALATRTGIG